ncbi:hypothetical protein GW796_00790 [archaeon]|nr:hypothetical protein [archaeon]NCQ50442.1 hypothetical protein [archaeon]
MTFSQFTMTYKLILIMLKLFVLLILGIWIKNSFNYFEGANIFSYINDISKIEKNLGQIWLIVNHWLIDTAWLMLNVIIVQVLSWGFKRIPVASKFLEYWDNLGGISYILGRYITNHLRRNNLINFMDIVYLSEISNAELSLITKHSKNEVLFKLFSKYDKNFKQDLENK